MPARLALCLALLGGCRSDQAGRDAAPRASASTATSALASASPAPASASASASASAAASSELVLPGASGRWSGTDGDVSAPMTALWSSRDLVVAVGSGVVLRSPDRGEHWKSALEPNSDFRALSVWGSSPDDVYVGGNYALLHSTDGARTFEPLGEPMADVCGLWGSGPNDVYAVVLGRRVRHSNDRGRTWQKLGNDPALRACAIAGTGANDVWLGGHAGTGYETTAALAHTTDGGKTWKRASVATTGDKTEGIAGLCFTASGTLVAAYARGVWGTTDGARTWRRLLDVPSRTSAVACRGRTIVVTVHGGALRRSTDEGATWSADELAGSFDPSASIGLPALFVGDGGETYAGGESAKRPAAGSLLRRAP